MNADDPRDWPALNAGKYMRQERLQQGSYTVALLVEGQRAGLLGSREVYAAQGDLLLVLERLIRRYTQGESSSLAAATAESLLTSILYATDLELRSAGEPERALARLRTDGIGAIYDSGVERVGALFADAKRLYGEVKRSKLDLPVDAYQMTIDESLPVFMKKYSVIFEAHNTMASIDYPLAADDTRLEGVCYIKQYLERLQLETRFVEQFPREDLLDLLADYGRTCRFDYRIELFNVFELVLRNALFSLLAGGSAREVRISPERLAGLKLRLASLDAAALGALMREAIEALQREWAIVDPQLLAYMRLGEVDLTQRLHHAVRHDSLEAIVITAKAKQIQPAVLSLNVADRMSDAQLRKYVAQMSGCKTTAAKIKLIRTGFQSLHDYLDMLESGCLYGDEYDALFAAFGDTELAVLAKIVLYEELRGFPGDGAAALRSAKTADGQWQQRLLDYLAGLSGRRLASIGDCLDRLD